MLHSDPVKIDLTNAWRSWDRMMDGAVALLPDFILAMVIFLIFLFLASISRSLTRRVSLRRTHHGNLGILLSQLAYWTVVIIGILTAISAIALLFKYPISSRSSASAA